jgi:hypothetical protein
MNEKEMLPEEEVLELRMYFFVPYNISPIQQGIQAGHALGRYCLKYGRHDPNHVVWDFLEKFETWVILDGGTTNDERDFEAIPTGSLNLIGDQLQDNEIEFSYMIEPDLNRALSALCIICDERVFNKKLYPNLVDYLFAIPLVYPESPYKSIKEFSYDELVEKFPTEYKQWVRLLGGVKNAFLRNLIKDMRKA